MKSPRPYRTEFRTRRWPAGAIVLLGLGLGLAPRPYAFDLGAPDDVTAVSSRASRDYVRTRLANGSFAPETYAFGEGGMWPGAMQDQSLTKLNFMDVARVIALPLANRDYVSAKDPKSTKLLIMVYWGETQGAIHPEESDAYVNLQAANGEQNFAKAESAAAAQTTTTRNPLINTANAILWGADNGVTTALAMAVAENRERDQNDLMNVKLLGYDSWWEKTDGVHAGTALNQDRQDLLLEVEESRYFVVLMAYDFQVLWKEKRHKLLWETRFSIRQRHHAFDQDLPSMARYASRYFGRNSNGLIHDEIPLGRVDIGDLKTVDDAPQK